MQKKQWLASACLALMPLAVIGQPQHAETHPADARIDVPAPRYESVFQAYRSVSDDDTTPDTVWRAINDQVREIGGHAGHVKDSNAAATPDSVKHGKHHQHH